MNLWLDDERNPESPFTRTAFGSTGEELWVKTAKEAIDLLKSGKVKSISFDHDLGSPENGTGYDVSKYIEEQAFHNNINKLQWRVHSANPVGKRNIERCMQSAERFWRESND